MLAIIMTMELQGAFAVTHHILQTSIAEDLGLILKLSRIYGATEGNAWDQTLDFHALE
jgi:hypothetical protein